MLGLVYSSFSFSPPKNKILSKDQNTNNRFALFAWSSFCDVLLGGHKLQVSEILRQKLEFQKYQPKQGCFF